MVTQFSHHRGVGTPRPPANRRPVMIRAASGFSQVLSLANRNDFEHAVGRHGAETGAKRFSCWEQLVLRSEATSQSSIRGDGAIQPLAVPRPVGVARRAVPDARGGAVAPTRPSLRSETWTAANGTFPGPAPKPVSNALKPRSTGPRIANERHIELSWPAMMQYDASVSVLVCC